MMKAAFVGFGELGHQLYPFVCSQYKPHSITLFDDYYKGDLGETLGFENFTNEKFADHSFFIAIGYKHLQRKYEILNTLTGLGRDLPNLVHPSCYVSEKALLGKAVYIYPMCNIDKEVVIHGGCLLNNSVTVSHNSTIESCTYISPGATLSGSVHIGKRVFIGTGSNFSNDIHVGDDVRIAVGTTVTKNIAEGLSVIGNPMRVLRKCLDIK